MCALPSNCVLVLWVRHVPRYSGLVWSCYFALAMLFNAQKMRYSK